MTSHGLDASRIFLFAVAAAGIVINVLALARVGPWKDRPQRTALPLLLLSTGIGIGALSGFPSTHRMLWNSILLPPSMVLVLLSVYFFLRVAARR
ncbi:hypothetical protein PV396_27005 [Streptomyces sp. ME02-8801-2C]|uniref:hypothetical protein n=1 Tax=Streptomyces sp. ME02-8801-2C TaxID=3028680 RepID=UPI0029A58CDF|nr:hypothetical protein [Streptomyces sp. ME02-8801-2C]MDX3455541.1 hypothetical protein [Streptomyces sp. ME02-8801-2C]